MDSPLGRFLLLGNPQRYVFAEFARFIGADDDADAAYLLMSTGSERGHGLVGDFLIHLRAEGNDAEGQRERIVALAAVVARAHRLGVGPWVLDVDRTFRLADEAPARALLPNGGDRRSAQFQRCDQAMRRGTTSYYVARLARDRPDIFAGYRRGEFRSVRQAAVAAGFLRARIARKGRVSRRNSPATTNPLGGVV